MFVGRAHNADEPSEESNTAGDRTCQRLRARKLAVDLYPLFPNDRI